VPTSLGPRSLGPRIDRDHRAVPVCIVADAWDGAEIREALLAYFEMAAGRSAESVAVKQEQEIVAFQAGGASHLVVYVGHNGLMEFRMDAPAPPAKESLARSAMVLAGASRSNFGDHLRSAGAHPLLLTTGLMAPEAYTLDGAGLKTLEQGLLFFRTWPVAAVFPLENHLGRAVLGPDEHPALELKREHLAVGVGGLEAEVNIELLDEVIAGPQGAGEIERGTQVGIEMEAPAVGCER